MKILAIETSCDETAAAVIEQTDNSVSILSNIVSSQIDLHKAYGGVFPEIASRAHTENIIPVISEALLKGAGLSSSEAAASRTASETGLEWAPENERISRDRLNDINIIAVTSGPGLIGSLLVGVNSARTLALATNKPIIPINHWLGHIYSCFAGKISNDKFLISNQFQNSNLKIKNSDNIPKFPLLALIVSGGHTGLVLMKSHTKIETLGQTLDDAAGEAFDKVAKLLDLGYPGGPAISKLAVTGNSDRFTFPRSMLDRKDFNFSFSGLKTAVLYESKKHELDDKNKADFAASFQQCVIDILIGKTLKAAEEFKPQSILLCGGVSANKALREQMANKIQEYFPNTAFFVPPLELTGDNAAMIGLAAAYQIAAGVKPVHYNEISTDSNLKL